MAQDLQKNKKEMEEFIQTAKQQLQDAVNEAYKSFGESEIPSLEFDYDETNEFDTGITKLKEQQIQIGDQTITINVPSFNFKFSDNSHLKWINTLLAANFPTERFVDGHGHSIGIKEDLPLWQFIKQMRKKVLKSDMNLTFLCIKQYAAAWLKEHLGDEDFYEHLGLAQPNEDDQAVKNCIEQSVTQCMNPTGKPMVFQSISAMSHPHLRDGEGQTANAPPSIGLLK